MKKRIHTLKSIWRGIIGISLEIWLAVSFIILGYTVCTFWRVVIR